MSPSPIDHLVLRATDAVMAAIKAKKGEAETRKRVAAAVTAQLKEMRTMAFDQAINAVSDRRHQP